MNRKQLALLITLLMVITAYFLMGGEEMLDLRSYQALYGRSPVATAGIYFLVYVAGTALSLPVSGVLAITGGMIFGHIVGIPLVVLACSTGGTLAFLSSRYLLHDLVQRRFAIQYEVVNRGIKKDGVFYVFSLRMIPVIPFWLLNLLMGLTSINSAQFYLATLTGMVPVTAILVYFGSQIGAVDSFSVREIFTPGLLLSLLLLGMMPFIAKGILALVQRQRNRSGV